MILEVGGKPQIQGYVLINGVKQPKDMPLRLGQGRRVTFGGGVPM